MSPQSATSVGHSVAPDDKQSALDMLSSRRSAGMNNLSGNQHEYDAVVHKSFETDKKDMVMTESRFHNEEGPI